jgi:serine/threonine protein kinase
MQVPYLERYEILQTLGQGGMGVVYLARQKKLDRLVAIKAISPYLAQEPEVRERFAAEASVLARLSHPNIVTLYDYIEEPDALYLVMEYVEGKPLSEILKAGPLPLESIRKYFHQILDAFAYAHSKGIIHRDIKPSNIIITPEGQVKILDFGVAKILSSDHTQTRTGMRVGTLMYMSPEQVKGEKNLDARSDIYSLGVVLFEMLTGKPPYDPELGDFEISLRIVREPLFDFSHPPATIPQKLLEVVLHATEKSPEHRIPSCKEFEEAFERAFAGETISALPATEILPAPPSATQAPRWRRWSLAVVAVATLLLLVGGLFWWFRSDRASQPPAGDTTQVVDTLARAAQDTLSPAETLSTPSAPQAMVPEVKQNQPAPTKAPEGSKRPSQAPATSAKKSSTTAPASEPASSPDNIPAQAPAPTSSFQEALKADVQDFKKYGILQVKAVLVVSNSSARSWQNVQITLRLLSKEGKVKKTETLQVPEILPYGRWEKKLDYMVGGTASIEAEVVSAEPGP